MMDHSYPSSKKEEDDESGSHSDNERRPSNGRHSTPLPQTNFERADAAETSARERRSKSESFLTPKGVPLKAHSKKIQFDINLQILADVCSRMRSIETGSPRPECARAKPLCQNRGTNSNGSSQEDIERERMPPPPPPPPQRFHANRQLAVRPKTYVAATTKATNQANSPAHTRENREPMPGPSGVVQEGMRQTSALPSAMSTPVDLVCYRCNRQFATDKELDQHVHTEHRMWFQCIVCPCKFASFVEYNHHQLTHEAVDGQHLCQWCKTAYATRDLLAAHIRDHEESNLHSCEFCRRTFFSRTELITHEVVHVGERTFKCHLCRFASTQKSTLTKHIREHNIEETFICRICDQSFTQSALLLRHQTVHSGETYLFSCDICGESYSRKAFLEKHLKKHEGTDAHPCDMCDKTFIQKLALNQHKRKGHGERSPK